ncbi:hypothetical protein D3C78_1520400 [compost metagenome]
MNDRLLVRNGLVPAGLLRSVVLALCGLAVRLRFQIVDFLLAQGDGLFGAIQLAGQIAQLLVDVVSLLLCRFPFFGYLLEFSVVQGAGLVLRDKHR